MSEKNASGDYVPLNRKRKKLQPGDRFSRLTVIEHLMDEEIGRRSRYVRVRCVCGTEKIVISKDLRSGNTKSCGCLKNERIVNLQKEKQQNRLTKGENQILSFRRYMKWYKRNAAARRIEWELSEIEFKMLAQKPCSYCGAEPKKKDKFAKEYANRFKSKGTKHNKTTYQDKIIYVNGIDRVDSNKGYNIDNCVTACSDCNLGKHVKSVDEFMDWIKKVYIYNNLDKL